MSTGIEIPIVSTYKDKGAKAASKSLGALTKSAKALGVAFGAYQTIRFSKNAVKAFADDQKAANALSKTLQNLGQSYAVISTAGFIQNLQNTTGVLDDELRPAFTQLVNATLDAKKAQTLLSVALDTSAGTGADLASVTAALSKAALGQKTALLRLGVGLTATEAKTMDLDEITKFLANRFNGQASLAAESFAGKMDILKAKTEDAKEMIGGALVGALDDAFGNPEKYGSGIDVLSTKISGLISKFGELAKFTRVGLENLTLSPSSPLFQYKLNFDKPFDPMAMKFDYTALQKEEKKLQKDAKKLAAARAAAIRKEQQLQKNQEKLKKFGGLFDIEQIEIFAALQGKITEQEKLRLNLQLSLIQGNATEAQKLGTELAIAQLQTTDLATAIARIPKALNPFDGFGNEVDNLIAKILKMNSLLTNTMQTSAISKAITPPTFAEYTNQLYGGHPSSIAPKPSSQPAPTFLDYSSQMFGGHPTSGNIINNYTINGATTDLINQLRNGLIDSSASGSFSSINPFR